MGPQEVKHNWAHTHTQDLSSWVAVRTPWENGIRAQDLTPVTKKEGSELTTCTPQMPAQQLRSDSPELSRGTQYRGHEQRETKNMGMEDIKVHWRIKACAQSRWLWPRKGHFPKTSQNPTSVMWQKAQMAVVGRYEQWGVFTFDPQEFKEWAGPYQGNGVQKDLGSMVHWGCHVSAHKSQSLSFQNFC